MFFSCKNAIQRAFVLEIDGKRVSCQENPSGIFANVELKKGKHLLRLRRRTFFDTPLYYLNIINPLYFIWHSKYLNAQKAGYDEDFSAIEIEFWIDDEQAGRIELSSEKITNIYVGMYHTLRCEQYSGIKKVNISNPAMDKIKVMRYRLTRVLSVLFYMLIFSILALLGFIEGIISTTETLVFCFLNLCINSINIFCAIAEKSVSQNLMQAKANKKRRK